jgi:predicted nucleotidyltransferase component of viral defense system
MSAKANLAASIRARLLNHAKKQDAEFQQVLIRFTLERFLYRLSVSPHGERFVLKGALLFDLWFDVPHRPTRDADFLGFGSSDLGTLAATFREVAAITVDDGIIFDPESVRAAEIRKDANYAGVRVTLLGTLDNARCPAQFDIGFGDAVTPAPIETEFPVLLDDLPAPRLRVYPRETAIAEKFEALVKLGIANSRMKDYFDLWVLLRDGAVVADTLTPAIRSTFERRGTPLPMAIPFGLSDDFARDVTKQRQWQAFLAKNALDAPNLDEIVAVLREALTKRV